MTRLFRNHWQSCLLLILWFDIIISVIISNMWKYIWKINLQFFIAISWGTQTTFSSWIWFSFYDSFINQLLPIVHTLYKAFDAYCTLDTGGVFLDMSKAFDKVWHEGLICKLKSMGVSDSLLKPIQSFLLNRF